MDKHTSGPWRIRGNEIGKRIESDTQSHGMLAIIATVDVYDLPENAEANKSLICAAPALLQALESARAFIFRHAQSDCNTGELICKKTDILGNKPIVIKPIRRYS